MPEIMEWPQGETQDAVARAVEHLRAGRLVAFPTESVYEVAGLALAPQAVTQLQRLAGPEDRLTLVLGHAIQTYDWFPYFRGAGVRLARRFWPGPLVLVGGACLKLGLAQRLPLAIRRILAPDEQVALRFPDHAALRLAALQIGLPLVTAATDWTSSEQVIQAVAVKGMPAEVALVLQDGQTYFGQRASVVRVHGKEWTLERPGGLPVGEIEATAPCHIVFVCTGNTCRSPLAAGLLVKLLADRLGCGPADLPAHGFCVHSAGLAAMMGAEATPEAVMVAREFGADLGGHRSQLLTMEILAQADYLFAMTRSHLRVLEDVRGTVAPRLLSPSGQEVFDPIGGDADLYRACARQIQCCLQELLPELQEC
jgi:protein-tyrosine-phosphatase/tRNA A37 threonylcarbamoyladenosine synthetase subunit TsaC/SUA5/YrdC